MATQNHGKGLGGGFFTFAVASDSMRRTSGRFGWGLSASSKRRRAPVQSSLKKGLSPAYQASLNLLPRLILTGVSLMKSITAAEGMTKLKPWTMEPSGP